MLSKVQYTSVFLAWLTLACVASGKKYNDKVHWRGNPQRHVLETRQDEPILQERSNASFQFLNSATKPYQVTSLPDVPFAIGEMYAGLVPIDMKNASRALYFVFQPTIGKPVDEIVIWLNGGPGCSSLEGFFQENGRFIWPPGTASPIINEYSWVNLTNVLWVEQPVGTGFSIGDVTATNEEEIAQDFVQFFKNFETIFGIKKFKIYVTGESYAGRYVPYISSAMIDEKDTDYFDLSGAMTYDPCIGAYDYSAEEATVLPFVQENNEILGLNATFVTAMAALDASCGYAAYREKYLTFPPPSHQPAEFYDYDTAGACDIYDALFEAATMVNPCFNIYHITDSCPLVSDVLGFPGSLEYITPGLPIYFDRADVKAAMHAPSIEWSECSAGPVFVSPTTGPDDEYQYDTSLDPIQSVLPKVIEHTNRVLISNGDLDMVIITNGTLLSIQNMTWGGKLGFQRRPDKPIIITDPDLQYEAIFDANSYDGFDNPQGTMGIQHQERGLLWAETFQSGHQQPSYQPRSSYRHLQWVLGHIHEL